MLPRDKLARILLHGSKLLDGLNAALSCISYLCEQVREGQRGGIEAQQGGQRDGVECGDGVGQGCFLPNGSHLQAALVAGL